MTDNDKRVLKVFSQAGDELLWKHTQPVLQPQPSSHTSSIVTPKACRSWGMFVGVQRQNEMMGLSLWKGRI